MTFVADLVQSSTTTGVVTTNIVVALPNLLAAGLAPKVVKCWMSGVPAPGDDPDSFSEARDIAFSYGFAVSTSSRVAHGLFVDSGAATTSARRVRDAGAVLVLTDASGGAGALDVTDMSTVGQVTLTIDNDFPADYVFFVEAWGGTDITSATITAFNKGTGGPGTTAIATSNAPRYIEVVGNTQASGTNSSTAAHISIGRCWAPTLAQHVVSFSSVHNVAATDSYSYGITGEVHAFPFTTGVGDRCSITAVSSTGFTWNRIEADGTDRQMHALSVEGTFSGSLGTIASGIAGGLPITVTPGITARVYDVWSVCTVAQSTSDTASADAAVSIGAVSTADDSHGSVCIIDPDTADPSTGAAGFSNIYVYQDLDAAGAAEAAVEYSGRNEFTAVVIPAAERFLMWAALGDPDSANKKLRVARSSGIGFRKWN